MDTFRRTTYSVSHIRISHNKRNREQRTENKGGRYNRRNKELGIKIKDFNLLETGYIRIYGF